ncbi:CHAD domain-containing protein [Lichenicola sp.]|uniref:CHAD domain-containing protein n=1 Tax=Lichenicola sp. TaxID=2804529 RepID=UPI003B00F216
MRKAEPPPLSVGDTLGKSLRLVLAEGLDHLDAHRTDALAGVPEAIHQARVALRRLRSALKLFRRHLNPAARDGFNDALRGFGRTLGDARDWDVFVTETVPGVKKAQPGLADALTTLLEPAERARMQRHAAMRALLEDARTDAVLHDIRDWSAEPIAFFPRKMAGRLIEQEAAPLLDGLARTVRRRGSRLPEQDDEERHALRKALKSLRYGIEMLEALHDRETAKPYRQALSRLQEDLGQLNDAIAAAELVHRLPDLPGRAVIEAWAADRRQTALEELPAAWTQFRAMPSFW